MSQPYSHGSQERQHDKREERNEREEIRLLREQVQLLRQILAKLGPSPTPPTLQHIRIAFTPGGTMAAVIGPVTLSVGATATASVVGFDQTGAPMPARCRARPSPLRPGAAGQDVRASRHAGGCGALGPGAVMMSRVPSRFTS